jgi:L-rhamnose mutarotase
MNLKLIQKLRVMETTYTMIGNIRKGCSSDNLYQIIEDDNNGMLYLIKDIEKFKVADKNQKWYQEIMRVINKTIFFPHSTGTLYAYNTDEKETLSYLQNKFNTIYSFKGNCDKLISCMNVCENSDVSDVEIYKYAIEVLEITEINDSSDLIVFRKLEYGEKIAMYIRVIDSCMEGYGVQHFEVIPSMITAFKNGLVTIDKFNQ